MIGRRPYFAFGNSTGDQQMLEYTKGGGARAWACWCCTTTVSANTRMDPRKACPKSKIGHFSPELYDEAIKDGWIVVSMKNDWKRIFAFE